MFYKLHHHLVTIDSEYVPQPTDQATERTTQLQCPLLHDTVQTCVILPRTIPEWNSLPQEIVAPKSLDCFKSRLAAHQ